MMITDKTTNKTKEGFVVWAKTDDKKIYHFVQRDERLNWYAECEGTINVEETLVQQGLVTVKVQLTWKSDFSQGVGSCRLDNLTTEDPAGLAFMKAIDNALKTLGVGTTLADGQPISALNRGLTPEEVLDVAMNSELP